jgi:hypothetical protein
MSVIAVAIPTLVDGNERIRFRRGAVEPSRGLVPAMHTAMGNAITLIWLRKFLAERWSSVRELP